MDEIEVGSVDYESGQTQWLGFVEWEDGAFVGYPHEGVEQKRIDGWINFMLDVAPYNFRGKLGPDLLAAVVEQGGVAMGAVAREAQSS